MRFPICRTLAVLLCALSSCSEKGSSGPGRGPIVMRDSATIVTETDSAYLRDAVADFDVRETAPAAPAADMGTPAVAEAVEPQTASPRTAPSSPPTAAGGFTIDFGDVQVMLPGIAVQGGDKNVKGKNSAAYSVQDGTLPQGTITIRGGSVSKVQQRLSTGVTATRNGITLSLSGMTSSGSWQTLQSAGAGQYRLLALSDLAYGGASNAASIRAAVQKAAQGKRLPSKEVQAWLAAVKNTTRAGEAPTQVVARSATWRIDGKGAGGKSFSKEIRLDVPM